MNYFYAHTLIWKFLVKINMDYSPILKNIANHITLDQDEIDYFTSLLKPKSIKRKEFLIIKGEVARYTYFIVKGGLRNYKIDENGVERIAYFAIEDYWISDLYSFITETRATSFVDAIEDTEVLLISKRNLDKLYVQVPKFERLFRILYQNFIVAQNDRIMQNISLTADERYTNFLTKYPQLVQRIPQKQIAAYLGITPEFLSMLRKRMTRQ